jgi:hypothetical protein
MHPFVSQKSVDELVTTLLMLAEQRREYYALIQVVRAATTGIDEPIIHPRASVRHIDGGRAEVTFFREDAPDDETPGTVNRWQYLDENGEPVEGKVIEVTLRPTHRGTNVTFTCYADEYQTEFGRLLDDFGVPLAEPTERDQETQVDAAPTGDTPDDDAGREVQDAPTGDAPSTDTKLDTPTSDAHGENTNQDAPRGYADELESPRVFSGPAQQAGPPGSIYDGLPVPTGDRWSKADWRAIFQHFTDRDTAPDLRALTRVLLERSSKETLKYDYVKKKSGEYGRGELD